MRDRLIELIENTHWNWVKDSLDKKKINLCASKSLNETIADALLEDGWIRPPVKVGDVVEVRHGRWKYRQSPVGWQDFDYVECSGCGDRWILDGDFDLDFVTDRWYYCPNCGAKMDGEE